MPTCHGERNNWQACASKYSEQDMLQGWKKDITEHLQSIRTWETSFHLLNFPKQRNMIFRSCTLNASPDLQAEWHVILLLLFGLRWGEHSLNEHSRGNASHHDTPIWSNLDKEVNKIFVINMVTIVRKIHIPRSILVYQMKKRFMWIYVNRWHSN